MTETSRHTRIFMDYPQIPLISAADFASVKPPYVHFKRRYHEYIFYYILSGEMFLTEGWKEYHLKKNDTLLLEPSMEHHGNRPSVCRFFYVHFSWENVRMQDGQNRESGICLPKSHTMDTAQGILQAREGTERIAAAFHGMEPHDRQRAACRLLELFFTVSEDYAQGLSHRDIPVSGRAKQVIPELLTYLNRHYADPLSGDLLAQQFHYHFDYLNRQFRKWTGKTIFAYLNGIRTERARQLLETNFYTVEEVARQTGFHDIYYFSKVFKKQTGMTPGQVRRQAQGYPVP